MKKLFYLLVSVLCASSVWAQDTFYVSSTGSNDNPGTEEEPWYSLNSEAWTEGCTIIVMDEIYLDPVILMGDRQEEAAIKEVTIQGGSPEAAIMGLNDEEFEYEEENYSSFFDVKGGKLTLKDITLKNLRRVEGHTDGGMIYIDPYSELHLTNVTVKNTNTSLSIRGGAICSDGKLFADNVTFENCKGYQGGALCLRETENPIYARFNNCVFKNNSTVDGAADNGSGAGGGAMYIDGYEMDIAFDKCYFESNQALNTAGNASGGAIRMLTNSTEDIPCDANVSFTNCTFANNFSKGASGMLHWGRPEQGEVNLKFINNVLYKNRTSGPQANIITSQKDHATVDLTGSFIFVNNTSIMNNTGVDGLVLTDQTAINFSDFGGDFDMVFVNNIMLDCMTEAIDNGEGGTVDQLGWGWAIRETDGRSTGEYIIRNNVHDGVGGSYDATWGNGFLWYFNDADASTANQNKSVRGKSVDQKLSQLGIARVLTTSTEGVPYIAIETADGYAVDNGVESLIYEGEELIPQTDIRGVAKTGFSRDLGAFEYSDLSSAIAGEIDPDIRAYLNSASGILHLTEQAAAVQVYSMVGACVAAQNDVTSVDLQNLNHGVYIVRVVTSNGDVYTCKIKK